MKNTLIYGVLSLALAGFSFAAEEVDCLKIADSVKQQVSAEQSKVLEIVNREVSAAAGCSCEIVKAAIEASKADAAMVASIVETAATAAPEQMRLIAQCAIAAAPDALAEVQSVMAKLDPNSGDSGASAKGGAKDAKAPAQQVAAPETRNPLDRLAMPVPDPVIFFPPLLVKPPVVTKMNQCTCPHEHDH